MEIHLEFVSPNSCLIGFSYEKGQGFNSDEQLINFHEIGFGFFFGAIYLVFYKKKKVDE